MTPGGGGHPGEDAGLSDKISGNIIKITPDKSLKKVTIIIDHLKFLILAI